MDQGNRALLPGPTKPPHWIFFSKSFHIEPGKSGLSGPFSVAASKRSYQVFVVCVYRIEFFTSVCSFLPVFEAIVTENVTNFFVFGHLGSLEVINALLIALKMILIYIQALD